jgi:lactate dehydrogenase-like 2-hydroxyacid dehydrogenase
VEKNKKYHTVGTVLKYNRKTKNTTLSEQFKKSNRITVNTTLSEQFQNLIEKQKIPHCQDNSKI